MNFLVVTDNTKAAKDTMNGYTGTTLIHSGGNSKYLYWEWINAQDAHLKEVQESRHGHKPTVQPLAMILATWM